MSYPAYRFTYYMLVLGLLFTSCSTMAQTPLNDAAVLSQLAKYNIEFNSPGPNSKGSMPLGNGDLALNAWVEPGGDLMMYISKSDSWSENPAGNEGLLKLGRIRVHFAPDPFKSGKIFYERLHLVEGRIEIKIGNQLINIWVDANNPYVFIESTGKTPGTVSLTFESLRSQTEMAKKDSTTETTKSKLHPDKIFEATQNQITWVYENANQRVDAIKDLKFGATLTGEGLYSETPTLLKSGKPQFKQLIMLTAHTGRYHSATQWLSAIQQLLPKPDKLSTYKAAHQAWWKQFWLRSWIFVNGDQDAEKVSCAYNLQRFITACAGRGAYPIHHNGSLFVVDDTVMVNKGTRRTPVAVNGDFRYWGGRYWMQNTRHIYWPLIASGDYDIMQPFFKMYHDQVEANKSFIQKSLNAKGLIFGECQPFWGGLPNSTNNANGGYLTHYYTQVLELSAMMYDYYTTTLNEQFLKHTLLPIATDGIKFFTTRFKKNETGKLVFEPANAMETYWKTKNPSTDIAGYRYILQKLLQLPEKFTTKDQRLNWKTDLKMAPELPIGKKDSLRVILPAESTDGQIHNTENPELYPIFPFRLYGLNKPDLALAINTFNKRRITMVGCWHNDVISAALLGKTAAAQSELIKICTLKNAKDNKDNSFLFPAFWGPGHDYAPDQDHGGIIMTALQYMLLQQDGNTLSLFPAWPVGWNVNFKLNASGKRVVYAEWKNGKIKSSLIEQLK